MWAKMMLSEPKPYCIDKFLFYSHPCCSLTVLSFMGLTAPIITRITDNVLFGCPIKILNGIRNLAMLTWWNHSTTGEHFAILGGYKPRINHCVCLNYLFWSQYNNLRPVPLASLNFTMFGWLFVWKDHDDFWTIEWDIPLVWCCTDHQVGRFTLGVLRFLLPINCLVPK